MLSIVFSAYEMSKAQSAGSPEVEQIANELQSAHIQYNAENNCSSLVWICSNTQNKGIVMVSFLFLMAIFDNLQQWLTSIQNFLPHFNHFMTFYNKKSRILSQALVYFSIKFNRFSGLGLKA